GHAAVASKARAVEAYARQARDNELTRRAAQIRIRAERRVGQLLTDMADRGQRETQGGDRKSKFCDGTLIPSLKDLGITKTQAARWLKLLDVPDADFDAWLRARKTSLNGSAFAIVLDAAAVCHGTIPVKHTLHNPRSVKWKWSSFCWSIGILVFFCGCAEKRK